MIDSTLRGKNALIVGVANERSLAWSIAKLLHENGVQCAFTYQGEAIEKRIKPLVESLPNLNTGSKPWIQQMDVGSDADIQRCFAAYKKDFGKLDILIHSVAFADKQDLEGRFADTSREGFRKAMDISAYSLVALLREAEPLMELAGGGSCVTLSYYGAEKVVKNYNVMGVAKAALESSVRYLANDLGPKKIRVNAISAGPVKTLAAAGIRGFRNILGSAEQSTPLRENISADDVGYLGTFLCGVGGKHITGATLYVDSGLHILAGGFHEDSKSN
ncbi:MAG: enoyl-ACP reductase [Bdellovibrionales bacterium]|nr:enoyl-ACP reductase [Bdellovibrionales bacterium]